MTQNSDTVAETVNATAPQSAGLGRIQGVAVFASVLLPILAAYIVFYTGIGMPDGTINQGDLVEPPVAVGELAFDAQNGGPLRLADEAIKWRYLIVPAGRCDDACEKLLYTSRQVHIRLGKKADRLERLLVTAAPLSEEMQAFLERDHPRLRPVQLERRSLQQLQQQTATDNISGARALLVDQHGFAMMAYDNDHSGNQLLKDIKRLLKYSYEQ